jgi:hypothetical protein
LRAFLLRQVGERTQRRLQSFQLLPYFTAQSRYKAVSDFSSIDQLITVNRIVAALLADLAVCAFGISERLRREERPSDLVAAGGAAPMDRLIAAAVGLSDCNAPVVTALGAILAR